MSAHAERTLARRGRVEGHGLALLIIIVCALTPARADDAVAALTSLRAAAHRHGRDADRHARAAREALAREDFEAAAALALRARDARAEHRRLASASEGLIGPIVSASVPGLADDSFALREAAMSRLRRLDVRAAPLLEAWRPRLDLEGRERLQELLARAARMDADGVLHQWALSAQASSEYSSSSWAAAQATGPPDTPRPGDLPTAWATKLPDAGREWLELGYEDPVHPELVRIHETFNPGAVVKIEGQDLEGRWHELWAGKDETPGPDGWLEVPVALASPPLVRALRVTLDTSLVLGWNEIDAVELLGTPD